MQKEILTRSQIRRELLIQVRRALLRVAPLCAIFTAVALSVVFWCFAKRPPLYPLILFGICYVGFPLIIGWCVTFDALKTLRYAKKDSFKIITRQLKSSDEERKGNPYQIMSHKSYSFQFDGCKPYVATEGKIYCCTDLYKPDAKSLYDTAVAGDEFYLVTLSSNKIVLIYNSKYFYFNAEN